MTRRYREEAEKMTEHMQQLNAIYEKDAYGHDRQSVVGRVVQPIKTYDGK